MSVWWAFGLVYLLFAVACGGALWERERLLNAGGERGLKWWGALVLSAALWPVVGLLWGPSRPVPPQPPQDRDERLQPDGPWLLAPPKDWEGDWEVGPGRILYTGPASAPGVRTVVTRDVLRLREDPEGSIVMVTSENRLYTRYDGEWVAYRDPDCPRCDHDDHRCGGCGEPLPHAATVCRDCKEL